MSVGNEPTPAAPVPLIDTLSSANKIICIVILGMLTAFGPFCTDLYLPALPAITTDLSTDPATVQLSLTSSFLGLAIGQVFIGPLSDAYGRKSSLYASLALFVAASVGCAMAQNVWFLILMRLLQGIAGAGGVVLSRAMACDMFSGHNLTKFMSLLMTINSLAPIFGPIVGSIIVSFADWHLLFFLLAIWGAVLIAGCLFKVPETLPKEKRESRLGAAIVDMLKQLVNLKFLLLVLSMSFIMGGFFSYLAASPFVFQVIYGFSAVGYSLVFACNTVFISMMGLLSGRLSRRVGDERIVKLSICVMMCAGCATLAVALIEPESPIFAILSISFFVGMIGSTQTPGFGIVMAARTGGAGSASGIFGVMTFLFGALMSPLVGSMGDTSMIPLALCMIAAAFCSMLLFVIGLKVKKPAVA